MEKIKKKLGLKINFKISPKIISSINKPKNATIMFAKNLNQKQINKLNKIKNGVLILEKENKLIKKNIIQIIKNNPRAYYFNLLKKNINFNKSITKPKIGKNCDIHESVTIGSGCIIGDNTVIMANVVLGDNIKIGKNCTIKSNSVIGQRGFGNYINKKKVLETIDHYGSVEIENNVEIGALNTIAMGTIDNTIIKKNNKFDDHVHVAHNCIIGENNTFTAGTILGGSITIGKNNFFGLNSTVKNGIKIGNNNIIGAASNVIRDIKNNLTVYGNPSKNK